MLHNGWTLINGSPLQRITTQKMKKPVLHPALTGVWRRKTSVGSLLRPTCMLRKKNYKGKRENEKVKGKRREIKIRLLNV